MPRVSPYPQGFALGDKVWYTAVYNRSETQDRVGLSGRRRVDWEVLPLATTPASGILVGFRKLARGDILDLGEDGREWKHTGVVHCALVAFDLHHNPVEVPLDFLHKEIDK